MLFVADMYAQTVAFTGVETTAGNLTGDNYASVAVDGSGNVYFADMVNNRVLKVPPDDPNCTRGTCTTVGSGLNAPEGVAVDNSGNVYIADTNSNRVLKVPSGDLTCSVVSNCTNIGSGLLAPDGVTVDSSGNVYIADTSNNRVLLVPPSDLTCSIAGDCKIVGSGLNAPRSVAVDGSGNVYIADTNNNRVLKVPSGDLTCSVAGDCKNVGNGLASPAGVAIDGSGNLYIAYSVSKTVVKISPGDPTCSSGTCRTVGGGLHFPTGVAVDGSRNVYIADGARGFKVSPSGNFGSVPLNSETLGFSYIFTFTSGGKLNSIATLTLGAAGLDFQNLGGGGASYSNPNETLPTCDTSTIYSVGDTCLVNINFEPMTTGVRIGAVVLNNSAGAILASGPAWGIGAGPQLVFDPGTPTQLCSGLSLNTPYGIALDGAGYIYIVDSKNHRVLKLPPSDTTCSVAGDYTIIGGTLSGPGGVVVDGAGNVYIADRGTNLKVFKIPPNDQTCSVIGDCTAVGGTFSGANAPNAVAIDGDGSLYISDGTNHRVLKVPPSDQTCSIAGDCTIIATSAGLSNLYGTAIDGAGNIYITDSASTQILKVPPSDPTCSLGACTKIGSGLSIAVAVAVDGAGNVYAGDFNGSRHAILRIPPSDPTCSLGGCTTIGASVLQRITGIALDGRGNLYVSDGNTNTWFIDRNTVPSLSFKPTSVGSTSKDSPQAVTLDNIGTSVLIFPPPGAGTNPSISANFNIANSSTCPVISTISSSGFLTSGSTCTLQINFAPTVTGSIIGQTVVTDNNSPSFGYTTQTIPLTGTGIQIVLMPALLLNGTKGTAYSQTVVASGGGTTSPFTYAVTSGSLPPGLVLTVVTGAITGTPTAAGIYSFTITATDSTTAANGGPFKGSQAYAVSIQGVLPSTSIILTSNLNPSLVGQNITFTATIPTGITGTISFNDGGIAVANCDSQAINTATGVATCTTSVLINGVHSITAVFTSSDGSYVSGVTSAVYYQGVNLQNLGSTNVGSSIAAPVVESFVLPTGTTLGSTPYKVLTQGNTGTDFVAASTQSSMVCASQTYTALQLCTVTVNFTAIAPGQRQGAIALYDSTGAAISTFYIYGLGIGPEMAYVPASIKIIVNNGFVLPSGIAVDAIGNVYVSDTNNNRILKETLSGGTYTQSVVQTGLNLPYSVAVDGAGNVFVADYGSKRILRETPNALGSGYTQSVVSTLPGYALSVAVDNVGTVYSSSGSGLIVSMWAGNGYTAGSPIDPGLGSVWGIAFDSFGNIYATTSSAVYKETFSSGSYIRSSIGSGWNVAFGIAVDPAGNVYVSDQLSNIVKKEIWTGSGYTQTTYIGTGLQSPHALALDSGGNLYIANTSAANIIMLAIPSLNFGKVSLGSSSAAQNVTITNIGNTSLDINNVVTSSGFNTASATTTCSINGQTLSVNGTCVLGYKFAPAVEGDNTGTSTLTNNVVGIANSAQVITLNGTGVLITLSPSTLPSGTEGLAYSQNELATSLEATSPYTYAVTSGALPQGLSLNSTTGVIAGTPTIVGTYNFTIRATDSTTPANGGPFTGSQAYTVLIAKHMPLASDLTVASNINPSIYGNAVTFTATLNSTNNPGATGTVTFAEGATVLCSAVTISGGIATCTASTLVVGTHPIAAAYSGDSNYNGITSAALNQVVKQAVLTVTADNQVRVFGEENPTLTYLITGFVSGDKMNVVLGAPVLSTIATASSPVGIYPITIAAGTLTTVNYSFTFMPGMLTIIQATGASSSTTLTVSPPTVQYGDTSTLMAVVSPAGAAGTVTFTAMPVSGGSAITLGTSSAANNGTAVWPENMLAVGTYNIVATYNGDPDIGGSASNTVQLTVIQRTAPGGGPALTVTVSDTSRTTVQSNPSFSYMVSGDLVNGDAYDTAVTGTPTYSAYSGPMIGSYTISIPSGLTSQNYLISFVNGTLTVVIAPTTTTLSASPSSSQYGDSVTLAAMVAPIAATGTVSFYDESVYLGDGAVSGGVATLITTALNAGPHMITAIYNGDTTYASSISNPATVTVAKKTAPGGGSALTVTVQNASREYGTANPQFAYVVTGTLVNNDTYSAAVASVPSYTTTDTPISPAGSMFPISVSGLTSRNYEVTYVNGALTIVQSPTVAALSVNANANAVQYGDPVTLTATVTSGATGLVSFVSGSTVLGQATLSGSIATLVSTTLTAGSYVVTAVYQGDGNFGSSTSNPVALTVTKRTAPDGSAALTVTVGNASRSYGQGNPAFSYTVTGTLVNTDTYASAVTDVPVYTTTATQTSPVGSYPISVSGLNSDNYVIAFVNGTLTVTQGTPAVTIASSLNPSTFGQSVTFTATVSTGASGAMNFMDGAAVLCGNVAISNDTATCTVSALAVGTHSVTAVYLGKADFNGATSAVLSQVVISVADFAIAATPATQIVPPGASTSYTVKLTSVIALYTNAVTLTATGLPSGATYTFSPSSVILGTNGANSNLTITAPRPNASAASKFGTNIPFMLAALFLPLAIWGKGKKVRLVLVMLVAFAGFSALAGCGAGGYFTQSQQSYTITITGTSGNLTHSTTVILTVE